MKLSFSRRSSRVSMMTGVENSSSLEHRLFKDLVELRVFWIGVRCGRRSNGRLYRRCGAPGQCDACSAGESAGKKPTTVGFDWHDPSLKLTRVSGRLQDSTVIHRAGGYLPAFTRAGSWLSDPRAIPATFARTARSAAPQCRRGRTSGRRVHQSGSAGDRSRSVVWRGSAGRGSSG